MKKLNWLQILACAVAGIAGSLIVKTIMSNPAAWVGFTSISAGEWLQAGAAIIGVFLTIQGTLWLEEQKRKRERKEEQRLIREALVLLKSVLPSASQPLNVELGLSKRILKTQAHYEMLRTGMASLAYARQNYRVRSYNLWNSLSGIDIIYATRRERITNEENIIRGNHDTETVLAICREKIEEYAGELIQPVNDASDALVKEQS